MTDVITYKGLYDAYRECRRRKRHTANTQRYEMALLDNLFGTLASLQQQRYTPTRSIRFMVKKPKAREIYAADFADRVVHHWLVPRLEALFEPIFIDDVYSNRKAKGIHSAVKRLQGFMQAVNTPCLMNKVHTNKNEALKKGGAFDQSINPLAKNEGWYLQLDIANFFNTIDKPILFKRLQKGLSKAHKQHKISSDEAQTLRWLSHVILKHDATKHAVFRGKFSSSYGVPPHKQLGNMGLNKGIAIGNLSSQFFANVYLNPLDQYIKHDLKCRYYCRYVDDFILLADKPKTLIDWRDKIIHFLAKECELELKEVTQPKRVTQGADFLGYITFPHHRLVRRRVVGNCREKLQFFEKQLLVGDCVTGYKITLKPPVLDALRATLNSYWAHFKHANSYHLRQQLLNQFKWLVLLFEAKALLMPNELAKRSRLKSQPESAKWIKPSWEPAAVSGYNSQIRFFQGAFPSAVIHIQRGRQTDTFVPQAATSKSAPQTLCSQNTLRNAVSKAHIIQQGTLKGGLKRRCVQALFIQPGVELCHS